MYWVSWFYIVVRFYALCCRHRCVFWVVFSEWCWLRVHRIRAYWVLIAPSFWWLIYVLNSLVSVLHSLLRSESLLSLLWLSESCLCLIWVTFSLSPNVWFSTVRLLRVCVYWVFLGLCYVRCWVFDFELISCCSFVVICLNSQPSFVASYEFLSFIVRVDCLQLFRVPASQFCLGPFRVTCWIYGFVFVCNQLSCVLLPSCVLVLLLCPNARVCLSPAKHCLPFLSFYDFRVEFAF